MAGHWKYKFLVKVSYQLIKAGTYCMPLITLKQLETHGCELSTEVTDALVLKHQVISTHSVDQIFIELD